MLLSLTSLSSKFSLGKNVHALCIFALNPVGGSFVNLMDLSRIPIGIAVDGFADKRSLKFGDPDPVLAWKNSNYFSSAPKNVGIK